VENALVAKRVSQRLVLNILPSRTPKKRSAETNDKRRSTDRFTGDHLTDFWC